MNWALPIPVLRKTGTGRAVLSLCIFDWLSVLLGIVVVAAKGKSGLNRGVDGVVWKGLAAIA